MKWLGYRNDFTRGYNAWCLVETAGYPIMLRPFFSGGGDDLKFIDRHRGNSGIVWGVASALVIGLNIDQKTDRP